MNNTLFKNTQKDLLPTIAFANSQHRVGKPSGSKYDLPVLGLDIDTQEEHLIPIHVTNLPLGTPRNIDTAWVLG